MYGFKKIILSRKGYDSTAGGSYSPFDPETGKYIVLPIPVNEEEFKISNPLKFEYIKIKSDYLPGYDASNLKDLIKATGRKQIIRKKHGLAHSDYAHVDPWLGWCPWLCDESNHHTGAFGQGNAAQGHLSKNAVGLGSLFLFFSRFTPIRGRENRIGVPIDPRKGAYFLYGWLKVGRIAKSFVDIQDKELELRHPHATEAYFNKYKNNTIYISDKFLSGESEIPGCGYFPRLSKKLLLTSEHYYKTPTTWELPGFFYELDHRPTYLKKESRWKLEKDEVKCLVTIVARGQEFVFNESEGFCSWFEELLGEINK